MAMTGSSLGGEIARLLQLPPETNYIQITFGLEEPVEVTCRYYPNADTVGPLQQLIQKFHVVAVGDPTTAEDAIFATRDRQAKRERRRMQVFRRQQLQEEMLLQLLAKLDPAQHYSLQDLAAAVAALTPPITEDDDLYG